MTARVRTWIEIDAGALRENAKRFLKLLPRHMQFMAVVKSNAYGHGLSLIAEQLANFQFSISENVCGLGWTR